MLLVIPLVGGWCNAFDRNGVDRERIVAFSRKFHGNKEEHYLSRLAEVIYRLRQGATKHEAIHGVHYLKDWSLIDPESPLGYASCLGMLLAQLGFYLHPSQCDEVLLWR